MMATVLDVAKCFLWLDEQNDGEGISNLKLQKLAYYAQGFYSAIFGEKLYESEISAWTHGPVVADLYHQFKNFGSNKIVIEDNDSFELIDNEKELLKEVYDVFAQYSAWKLRDMTHEEKPWIDNEASASIIPFEEIREYFLTRI